MEQTVCFGFLEEIFASTYHRRERGGLEGGRGRGISSFSLGRTLSILSNLCRRVQF